MVAVDAAAAAVEQGGAGFDEGEAVAVDQAAVAEALGGTQAGCAAGLDVAARAVVDIGGAQVHAFAALQGVAVVQTACAFYAEAAAGFDIGLAAEVVLQGDAQIAAGGKPAAVGEGLGLDAGIFAGEDFA